MIPVGYLYKIVAPRPGWIDAGTVVDICSVSNCILDAFADYVHFWEHNGCWLFDSPAIIESIASREGIDLSKTSLFYYEAHDEEFDGTSGVWRKFGPEPSFVTNVEQPHDKQALGFDVVTFWAGTGPECSPLSCNAVAEDMPVNRHCLFDSFEAAKQAIDGGAFANTEPGSFRIMAVFAISPRREIPGARQA
jgi:hypothetical protein